MEYCLDFGLTKRKLACLRQGERRVNFIEPKKLLYTLKNGDQVFLEFGGHSEWFVRQALKKGISVYQIYGGHVAKKREELGWQKSEINDAKTVAILAIEKPDLFFKAKMPNIELLIIEELLKIYRKIEENLGDLEQTRISKSEKPALFDGVTKVLYEVFQEGRSLGYQTDPGLWLDSIKTSIQMHTGNLKIFKEVFEPVVGEGRIFECAQVIHFIKDINRFGDEYKLRKMARFYITKDNKRVTAKMTGGSKILHGLILKLADYAIFQYKNVDHPFWRDRIEQIYQRQLAKRDPRTAERNTKNTIARLIIREIFRRWKRLE